MLWFIDADNLSLNSLYLLVFRFDLFLGFHSFALAVCNVFLHINRKAFAALEKVNIMIGVENYCHLGKYNDAKNLYSFF